MRDAIIYFLIAFSVSTAFSARILAVIPIATYSHQVVYQQLWRELSLRGHKVTVLSTNPVKDPLLTNLTEIDLSFSYDKWTQTNVAKFSNLTVFGMMDYAMKLTKEMFALQFEYPPVRALIENETEHFDVVLAEGIFPVTYAYAERFKCPLISVDTFDALRRSYKSLGNPVHPILNPDLVLPFSGNLNFFQRILSVFWTIYDDLYYTPTMLGHQQDLVYKYFGKDYPKFSEIERNVSLMFVNADSVFHRIRPRLPNIIEVGGGIHIKIPKPLSTDLQKKLDGAKQGFIYFSLGSNVKSKDLPDKVRSMITKTLSKLPYLVLWKFELENLPKKPSNVIISKWFPQQDILRHPNIKLFITQGGLQSSDESIHSRVPMICIPFMGDQPKNAQNIVNKGIGLQLNIHTLDEDEFKASIVEVTQNPKYKENIVNLAYLIEDLPMTGLEKAVWWTEYVIRHKGAKHLRSPAMDLPTYQYFLLDVIGFCVIVISAIFFIVIQMLQFSVKVLRKLLGNSKVKNE